MGEDRQMVLSHVRRTVTEDMRVRLLAPFSREELDAALKALAKESCPGVDSLTLAFYLRHWDTFHLVHTSRASRIFGKRYLRYPYSEYSQGTCSVAQFGKYDSDS